MEWTTEQPKVDGYYWALEAGDPEDVDIYLVKVMLFRDGEQVLLYGSHDFDRFSDFSHWIGPIEKPPYPEGFGQ